jgi:hypothetical protein
MAIGHFLLGMMNLDNGFIFVTQVLAAITWTGMAYNAHIES